MLNNIDAQFHQLYSAIANYGNKKGDRTAVGTHMLPAQMMRFDVSGGQMPILSTRLIRYVNSFWEMELFKSGNPSIKLLCDRKIGLWDSWFIPGTAVYADEQWKDLNTLERAQHMCDGGNFATLNYFFTQFANDYPNWCGNQQVQVTTPDGEVHVWRTLPQEEIDSLAIWMDTVTVPRRIKVKEAEPVSLAKRLTRVSKNDGAKWTVLYPRLVEGSFKEDDKLDTAVKVVGFNPTEGKFEDFFLNPEAVPTIHHHLNMMDVPANRLLDASIGEGSYGVQWRKWQDTHIVDDQSPANLAAYAAQGYTNAGELYVDDFPTGSVIMHREIDQLKNMIEMLKNNPDDRREIVTAWNPGRTWQAALPPCHLYFQTVSWVLDISDMERMLKTRQLFDKYLDGFRNEDGHPDFSSLGSEEDHLKHIQAFATAEGLPTRGLTMFVLLRSSDAPLGAVFNVAQYAYLLHSVAHVVNMEPQELITVGVDCHIYNNQLDAIEELLERGTAQDNDPRIRFKRKINNIDDITPDDVEIVNYVPGADIKIPVAV